MMPSSSTVEVEETKTWQEFMEQVKKALPDTFNEDEQTLKFDFKGKPIWINPPPSYRVMSEAIRDHSSEKPCTINLTFETIQKSDD